MRKHMKNLTPGQLFILDNCFILLVKKYKNGDWLVYEGFGLSLPCFHIESSNYVSFLSGLTPLFRTVESFWIQVPLEHEF